jgi:hypothetical protein
MPEWLSSRQNRHVTNSRIFCGEIDPSQFHHSHRKEKAFEEPALERDEENRNPVFQRNRVYADCVSISAFPALTL